MSDWDNIRKKARSVENEIDLKLVSLSKISSGASQDKDSAHLLGECIYENLSLEIEDKLANLAELNELMGNLPLNGGAAMTHTICRHRDILHGYRTEMNKIQNNHSIKIQREELLKCSGISLSPTSTSGAGLSRRDMFLKEQGHIHNSHSLINDQISLAIETKENLFSQRQNFKKLQTRFNDIANRFPMISSLLNRINIKKRRDTLILFLVIAGCTLLLILYTFH